MLDYKLELKTVEGCKGYVILKVPSMKERLMLLKEAGITGKDDAAGLDTLIQMMDKVSLFVKEVDLKVDGHEFKELESLGHYDFGMAAYTEIAGVVMNGIPRGKSLPAK